jgi:hypothetical protein
MKTPMQEMLEWVRETLPMDLETPRLITPRLIEYKIESMLEKEKEILIETSINSYTAGYLDNQAKVDDSMNFPEEYYNETFNTKEK